ncbi:phospholipid methyltransferase [Mycena alexandri]|uniref:Phosphatidyl-N-methylethanolamine N-methyltransferase n=1 Tax=Mycena alexandri TaxID=1745969 RepID=A0AAD6XDD1_9AGAR|nr:phospholipid methyltransferase [Mycena alexandri]
MSLPRGIDDIPTIVDWSQTSLYVSLFSIAASPLLWNLIGRNEYKNRTLTKLIGARTACFILGVSIFLAGLLRDVLYRIALHDQPRYPLPYEIQAILAWIIFGAGNFLVVSAYFQLGFWGTFCGDYFSILQEKRVTGFPFSILDNPMYFGAEMCFVGAALWYERPAGLLVALYVHLTYAVALRFEGPFTAMVYANHKSPGIQKHE